MAFVSPNSMAEYKNAQSQERILLPTWSHWRQISSAVSTASAKALIEKLTGIAKLTFLGI